MIILEELFEIAEQERNELKHPYVGTEHFMLAYLYKYNNNFITYDKFKKYIVDIIGVSNKQCEYVLYTPILRYIRNKCNNIYEAMIRILTDEDSIAYNLLLSNGEDIENIYLSVINTIY